MDRADAVAIAILLIVWVAVAMLHHISEIEQLNWDKQTKNHGGH